MIGVLFATGSFAVAGSGYDVYVDQSYSGEEKGTSEHPYDTIGEAVSAAMSKGSSHRKIRVANGTYKEEVVLGESVELYGENKNKTVIDGGSRDAAVRMKNNSKIRGVKIVKGSKGIVVEKNARASIVNCVVKETRSVGIDVREDVKDNRLVTIKNSVVSNNRGKGIYAVSRKELAILNNEISSNGQEGIDLRGKNGGRVKSNRIHRNKEGGIEMEVGGTSLSVRSNKMNGNKASGVSSQLYKGNTGKGKVVFISNTIKSNGKYGFDCGAPSGGTGVGKSYWQTSLSFGKNALTGNSKGAFSSSCGLKP
jgi:parallel beta-helix repeat protein